jgi:two-component system C4-dicarboxylate transport response regulator DctD
VTASAPTAGHDATNTVVLIDDDPDLLAATAQTLELAGWSVLPFASGAKALEVISAGFPGVVATDIRMPQMDGRRVFERVREIDPEIPVVFITGHADIAQAVEAMQQGAHDFVVKPFANERLLHALAGAVVRRRDVLERRTLRGAADQAQVDWPMIGQSTAMTSLRQRLRQVAQADVDTIIEGETGVGKELAARAIHTLSSRKNHPFVVINCGALPAGLVESELFGHELGAFPGAVRQRIGRMEYANRGVLFLDEIEATPPETQVKLLRFLEEREIAPLGSNEVRSVDVRVLVSTKLDLSDPRNAGAIRPDLFHRLNVARVRVPPLRERRADIPSLFAHFAANAADRLGVPVPSLSEPVRRALSDYEWPGNVRELAHFAERFALGLDEGPAQVDDGKIDGLRERVDRYEADLIAEALATHGGDVQRTVEALQLPRKTFYDKVRRYGIELERFRTKAGTAS